MRAWISVRFPLLPLQVFRPLWAEASPNGLVILDGERAIHVDRISREAGVVKGMRRGGALTLAPNVELRSRDELLELQVLKDVATALLRYSPLLALDAQHSVVLDVSASLRLFGGILNLCRLVRATLTAFGLTAVMSVAPTGRGAWLLTHGPRRRVLSLPSLERNIGRLPVGLLPAARPFISWFDGIGCDSIAGLRKLPRAGLKRRCGVGLLDQLDAALGEAPELYEWYEPPLTFDARVELPDRIEHAEAVLFSGRRLLVQLTGWLAARQLAVSGFTLNLEHERGREAIPSTPVDIALGEPTWREEHLVRLLKERLARVVLEAPVIALRLDAKDVTQAEAPSEELFPQPGGNAEDHARLLELLAARLGPENVVRPAPVADHRPEAANRWVSTATREKAVQPPGDLPRPAWLFDTPIQLMIRAHRPFYGSALRMVSTAERVECGWWDGQLVTRDYFVAKGEDHAHYWIYRERVGSRDEAEPRWFLHGLFA